MFLQVLTLLILWAPEPSIASITYDCLKPDPRIGFRYIPNCRGYSIEPDTEVLRPFNTNSQGIFDSEYPDMPRKGVYRILAVGGSMTVNYSKQEGWAPMLTEVFNKSWGAELKLLGFNRVEVISASEFSYNLVQTYLRHEELVEAYRPHMVLLLDSLPMLMEEFLFHKRSQVKDSESGLAVSYGNVSSFWPIPSFLDSWIWKRPWADKLRSLSDAIQIALFKYQVRIGHQTYCPPRSMKNCYLWWHLKYLLELRKKTAAKNIAFFVVSGFSENTAYGKARWYLGSSLAKFLAPWPPYSIAEAEEFFEKAKQERLAITNVTDIVNLAYERQSKSDESIKSFLLSKKNAMWANERIARFIFPEIRQLIVSGSSN